MHNRQLFLCILSAATMAACTNAEIGSSKNVGNEAIYADYKIWGEEGKETVNVLLQFRVGGPDGTTLVLENPGSVAIDGIPLRVDSAGITGAYYEAVFPLAHFGGKHFIVYTSTEGKQHRQEFTFSPFTLTKELAEELPMGPMSIELGGLPNQSSLRIAITDTSFVTNDVGEEVEAVNGVLKITPEMWQALKPGPIVFEIYREEEIDLSTFSKEGGLMTITYGLKREFTAVHGAYDSSIKKRPL